MPDRSQQVPAAINRTQTLHNLMLARERVHGLLAGAAIVLLLAPHPVLAQRGRDGGEGQAGGAPPLRFQWVGPEPAGRIAAVAGIPGDTTTYYIGAASGGIWKTTDGARTFAPIFDGQSVKAILGDVQRRSGERSVRVARHQLHLDADRGRGPPQVAGREDRRCGRAVHPWGKPRIDSANRDEIDLELQ